MPKGTSADWLTADDAKEVHLTFPREVHTDLMDVLFPSEGHPFYGMGERGAFAVLAKSTGTRRVSYIVEEVVHPESSNDLKLAGTPSDDDNDGGFIGSLFGTDSGGDISSNESMVGYEFSEDYHERAIKRARDRGGGLIRIHTQPGGVDESSADTASAARVYKNDRDRLPVGAPFAAAITDDDGDWSMRVYEPSREDDDLEITHADHVRMVGPTHDGWALDVGSSRL